jgi:hypothetical protein
MDNGNLYKSAIQHLIQASTPEILSAFTLELSADPHYSHINPIKKAEGVIPSPALMINLKMYLSYKTTAFYKSMPDSDNRVDFYTNH